VSTSRVRSVEPSVHDDESRIRVMLLQRVQLAGCGVSLRAGITMVTGGAKAAEQVREPGHSRPAC